MVLFSCWQKSLCALKCAILISLSMPVSAVEKDLTIQSGGK